MAAKPTPGPPPAERRAPAPPQRPEPPEPPEPPATREPGPPYRHAPALAMFVLGTLAVLSLDLAVKHLAFEHVAGEPVRLTPERAGDPAAIPEHEPTVLIPYLLHLKLTTNTGAVFGLGKGRQWFFVLVTLVVVPAIAYVFARSAARAYVVHASLALILGGALGNLYDRMRYSAVRDMFLMLPEAGLWPWIFNIADAALMVGVGALMVILWRSEKAAARTRTRG